MNFPQSTFKVPHLFKEINFHFPGYSKLLFLLLFISASIYYEIPEKLFIRPQGIHAWRQADCLSITLNYYKEGMNFFEPGIHNLSNDNTGKTVSDFPLLYFTAASLWKVFGQHEYIYRLLVLLIAFSGLFSLFLLMESLFKDSFWAIGLSMLVYTSPLFVYYSNNFLSNIPALSFAFIAWYFLYRFYIEGRSFHLSLAMVFFLFGGLMKTTALYSYVPVIFIYLTETLGIIKYREEVKIFKKPLRHSIPILFVPLLVFAWYLWAYNYNQRFNSNIFLIGILPVWKLSLQEIQNIWHHVDVLWLRVYFHKAIQIAAVLFYLVMVLSYRKMNKINYTLLVLMGFGFIMYLSFWFRVLDHHDYYLIDLLALLVVTLISFWYFMKANYPGIFSSVLFRGLFVIFLLFQVDYCAKRVNERYVGWRNETHLTYLQPMETITPYLRSLGIERNDKVISIPDGSINITLYLMDQKGWTNFNFPGGRVGHSVLAEKIMSGAKYLVINDTLTNRVEDYHSLIKKKAGRYESVTIYELIDGSDILD